MFGFNCKLYTTILLYIVHLSVFLMHYWLGIVVVVCLAWTVDLGRMSAVRRVWTPATILSPTSGRSARAHCPRPTCLSPSGYSWTWPMCHRGQFLVLTVPKWLAHIIFHISNYSFNMMQIRFFILIIWCLCLHKSIFLFFQINFFLMMKGLYWNTWVSKRSILLNIKLL